MTTTYTPNKQFALQGTGDNPNTWGTILNTNVFTIADLNLGGRLSISIAGSSDVTLSQTQANNVYHTMTGILTGNMSYILPNQGGFFFFKNSSTGSFTTTVKPAGGTGVVVPQGSTMALFMNPDASAAVPLFDTVPNLSVSSSTVPISGNGIYLPSASTVGIAANNALALSIVGVSTGVNYAQITNAATGNPILISALGSDTNIGIVIASKGSGAIGLYTNNAGTSALQLQITHTATAVNYLSVTGAVTGDFARIIANGSDTNTGIFYYTKGTSSHFFKTNAGAQTQLEIYHTNLTVNYWQLTGGAAGTGAILGVGGSDTNISANITSKGNANVILLGFGGTINIAAFTPAASAVNYWNLTSTTTGIGPGISAIGSDTNIAASLSSKGTGAVNLFVGGFATLIFSAQPVGAVVGSAAIATNSTTGPFLWLTSCAGAPTGAPTAPFTNAAAMLADTTNSKLWVRFGATWKGVVLA